VARRVVGLCGVVLSSEGGGQLGVPARSSARRAGQRSGAGGVNGARRGRLKEGEGRKEKK
jgi:hypothetical protein